MPLYSPLITKASEHHGKVAYGYSRLEQKYKTIPRDDVTIVRGVVSRVDGGECKGEDEEMESGGFNYMWYP